MTQAEKDKLIKELQDKLAEAEKIEVEQPKRWKPDENMKYWRVNNKGFCTYGYYTDDSYYDKWNYLTGNCFKTEKETKEYKKQIEYTARYKNYIEEHSEPLDWRDDRQVKYGAYYDFEDKNICVDTTKIYKDQGKIFASSEQIIWDAIKEIGEDNFKKYVLGVE